MFLMSFSQNILAQPGHGETTGSGGTMNTSGNSLLYNRHRIQKWFGLNYSPFKCLIGDIDILYLFNDLYSYKLKYK